MFLFFQVRNYFHIRKACQDASSKLRKGKTLQKRTFPGFKLWVLRMTIIGAFWGASYDFTCFWVRQNYELILSDFQIEIFILLLWLNWFPLFALNEYALNIREQKTQSVSWQYPKINLRGERLTMCLGIESWTQ